MILALSLATSAAAGAIDAAVGYPQALFGAIGHPVTWIGRLIGALDAKLNLGGLSYGRRRLHGVAAIAAIVIVAGGAGALIEGALLALPAALSFLLLAGVESTLIAQKSLADHVQAVAGALDRDGLEAGRAAVAAIVGRDVAALDEAAVCRAAIESLAENFSDGVVAPSLWLALLGLPGGAAYKAINTADSMIGHLTARHAAFGYGAAKLDDLVNLAPARWSALTVIVAAAALQGADAKAALACVRRDARGHPSPNAGWPEAAFAGALGLRLGGPRRYGARDVADRWIGDGAKTATTRDISRALRLFRAACLVNAGAIALAALLLIIARW